MSPCQVLSNLIHLEGARGDMEEDATKLNEDMEETEHLGPLEREDDGKEVNHDTISLTPLGHSTPHLHHLCIRYIPSSHQPSEHHGQ